MLLVSKL